MEFPHLRVKKFQMELFQYNSLMRKKRVLGRCFAEYGQTGVVIMRKYGAQIRSILYNKGRWQEKGNPGGKYDLIQDKRGGTLHVWT